MRKKNVSVPENYCHACYRLGSEILNAHQDIEDVLDAQTTGRGGAALLTKEEFRRLRKASGIIGRQVMKILPG